MADQLTYEAYSKLIGGVDTSLERVAYFKGNIAGMEQLFQNIDNSIEEFDVFVAGYDETMVVGDDDGN